MHFNHKNLILLRVWLGVLLCVYFVVCVYVVESSIFQRQRFNKQLEKYQQLNLLF